MPHWSQSERAQETRDKIRASVLSTVKNKRHISEEATLEEREKRKRLVEQLAHVAGIQYFGIESDYDHAFFLWSNLPLLLKSFVERLQNS